MSYEQDIRELNELVQAHQQSQWNHSSAAVSVALLARLLGYLEETNESAGYYATKARAKDLTISSLEGQIKALKLSLDQVKQQRDAAEARATNLGKLNLAFDEDMRQRLIEALS